MDFTLQFVLGVLTSKPLQQVSMDAQPVTADGKTASVIIEKQTNTTSRQTIAAVALFAALDESVAADGCRRDIEAATFVSNRCGDAERHKCYSKHLSS